MIGVQKSDSWDKLSLTVGESSHLPRFSLPELQNQITMVCNRGVVGTNKYLEVEEVFSRGPAIQKDYTTNVIFLRLMASQIQSVRLCFPSKLFTQRDAFVNNLHLDLQPPAADERSDS